MVKIMKEMYIAPEVEIVCFAAEEALANQLSFLGYDVTNQQDGDWSGWDQWFS